MADRGEQTTSAAACSSSSVAGDVLVACPVLPKLANRYDLLLAVNSSCKHCPVLLPSMYRASTVLIHVPFRHYMTSLCFPSS
jgi:hypothetical protein